MRLEELCDVTSSKRIYAKELVPSGVPFLKSKEIIEKVNGQGHSNLLFISEERFQQIIEQTGAPEAGDVLLTSRGTLGVPYVVRATDRFHFADGNLTWFRNFHNLDSRFLSYFFLSPSGRAELAKCVIGSSQAAYTIAALKKIEIALPPLPMQRSIASMLSAYDDLIENNTRRIAILEEMAWRVYEEWFVSFRCPSASPSTENGALPRGWRKMALSDLVQTQYGYTASASDDPVGPHFLRGMDINKRTHIDWTTVPYCPITPKDHEKFQLRVGDVLMIRMADPGKVALVEKDVDAVFASYLVRFTIRDDVVSPLFLFYTLSARRYQDFISGASTGTTRKSASAKLMTSPEIVVPPREVVSEFDGVVRPMRNLVNRLVEINANLRQQRDLLLPRLVSGKQRVRQASANREEATA
ncbi:restriction endonuclease subunit S [Lentisalinibacter orientalis]|uniref:restriction endonuclease subunit S n=1 Tax=Lentisalinibacter orientalis TaxID=2992241 RepID=UPI003864D5EE